MKKYVWTWEVFMDWFRCLIIYANRTINSAFYSVGCGPFWDQSRTHFFQCVLHSFSILNTNDKSKLEKMCRGPVADVTTSYPIYIYIIAEKNLCSNTISSCKTSHVRLPLILSTWFSVSPFWILRRKSYFHDS